MIEFRHVSKDFHGKVVLSDISMEIPTGELTVLIGPSRLWEDHHPKDDQPASLPIQRRNLDRWKEH